MLWNTVRQLSGGGRKPAGSFPGISIKTQKVCSRRSQASHVCNCPAFSTTHQEGIAMIALASDLLSTICARSFPTIKAFHLGLLTIVLASSLGEASSYLHAQSAPGQATRNSVPARNEQTINSQIASENSPFSFEPNVGQDASNARYIARIPGYQLRLDKSEAVIHVEAGGPGVEAGNGT